MLPKTILSEIECICRKFLWREPSLQKGCSKLAWKAICLPVKEGGLGLRSLHTWNRVLMLKHVWSIAARDSTIWPSWVRANLIGRECFWAMKIPKSSSWGWRKILLLRSLAQKHVSSTIGDETSISFWFDSWSAVGPLYLKVTNSFIYNTRIPRNAMQGQFIRDCVLLLPQTVLNLFHGQSLPDVR